MLSLLFQILLAFQTTVTPAAPVITDYAGNVKGVKIGSTACFIWPQTPAAGQVEIACYEGSVNTRIEVQTIGTVYSFSGSYAGANGAVSWYLYPGPTSPQIGYVIFGFVPPAGFGVVPATTWNTMGAVMVCCGPHEIGVV